MIDVDKDVPLPRPRVLRSYPYDVLRVGESFWVRGVRVQSIWTTNYRWSKRLGRRFVARVEGDGVRVWRVE